MNVLKGLSFMALFVLVLLGISYAYISSGGTLYEFGVSRETASFSEGRQATYHTRDFERNVYVSEPEEGIPISYSVVQGKNMVATLYGIYPDYILAKKGDTVKFNLNSDVNCNFFVSGYNINAKVRPATTTEVAFNADMPGIYAYGCKKFLYQKAGLIEIVD